MSAILWLLRTGSKWRNTGIGKLFTEGQPRINSMNGKPDGTLERINRELNLLDRKQQKREAYPAVFYIHSQSRRRCGVKLAPLICEYRGIDGLKKLNAGPPFRFILC